MPDLEELTTNAFREFDRALTGSGAEANREWAGVVTAKSTLERIGRDAAEGIQKIQEDPMLTDIERAHRIRAVQDLFSIGEKSASKELERSLSSLHDPR